jgi:hypothetical protein
VIEQRARIEGEWNPVGGEELGAVVGEIEYEYRPSG